MLTVQDMPVLEYDDSPTSRFDPMQMGLPQFDTDKMILTFFREVLGKLKERGEIYEDSVIEGEDPIIVYRFKEHRDVLITAGQVGCPACGSNMDYFAARGIRRLMFCGGGGVLDKTIEVGQALLVDGAIRDEGFSYQYIPPSRIVYADTEVNDRIAGYMDEHDIPYIRGIVWTTDALFRETPDRIARRKEEGAKIVEMEQAGCLAVAQFRHMRYGALIYGGDDVSGERWSGREWRSREGVRYDLVQLCVRLLDVI
ncbi:MAG: nucleoside phosphorylase [Oscillospiraceae bacterium]|nr:nucleoside phosphorylase [Oscillospiraceae bacterium]